VNRELIRSSAFIRATRRHLKKHPQQADNLEATLFLLSANAFAPQLKTHKLKGDLDGVWACSVYLLNRYRVELRAFLRWLRWRRLAMGVPIVD
jgi:mRNA-degrading endonuclease YafQ of YafQ-DinJ toxin-antitoxin module